MGEPGSLHVRVPQALLLEEASSVGSGQPEEVLQSQGPEMGLPRADHSTARHSPRECVHVTTPSPERDVVLIHHGFRRSVVPVDAQLSMAATAATAPFPELPADVAALLAKHFSSCAAGCMNRAPCAAGRRAGLCCVADC